MSSLTNEKKKENYQEIKVKSNLFNYSTWNKRRPFGRNRKIVSRTLRNISVVRACIEKLCIFERRTFYRHLARIHGKNLCTSRTLRANLHVLRERDREEFFFVETNLQIFLRETIRGPGEDRTILYKRFY